jgi:Rrf2 family protein
LGSSLYGAGAEYALHSLLVLAARSEPVSVRDLARFQDLPDRFLAKLFTRLEKAGLVDAIEGVNGGFRLARSPEHIAVWDVLEAADPNRTLFACAEIRRHCALFGKEAPGWSVSGTCRIHLVMKEAEEQLRGFLASKTIADLGREFSRKAPDKFVRDAENWFLERRIGRTAKRRARRRGGRGRRSRQEQVDAVNQGSPNK